MGVQELSNNTYCPTRTSKVTVGIYTYVGRIKLPYSKEMVGKPRSLIRMGISYPDVASKARNLCRLYRYRVSFKYILYPTPLITLIVPPKKCN